MLILCVVVCTFPNDVPTITIERISPDINFLDESIVQAGNFCGHITRSVGKMVYPWHCNAYKG